MNLQKLFEMQAVLDANITAKHPVQDGEDRLSKKIVALSVELSELMNEYRVFKFWSNDQKPRTEITVDVCRTCGGSGVPIGIPEETGIDCYTCGGGGEIVKNPLLEEYVDCLHFALSIGNDLQVYDFEGEADCSQTPMDAFMEVMAFTTDLYWLRKNGATEREQETDYKSILYHLLVLGASLGFKLDEIEAAYYEKNKVNHTRQEENY